MAIRVTQTVAIALLACMTLIGCQSAPPPQPRPAPAPSAPAGPFHEGYQRPRNPYFLPRPNLAMEPAEMQRMAGNREADALSWYDVRNDARMSVQSGYESRTFESVYTQTYDRQYQHGGQVRDHYSRWTRTGSVKEAVR